MLYRKLGLTELYVSEISVGCSGYWGNHNFSEKKALEIIYAAFERGVNFFDTGHNYSNFNAEPRLGRAIKRIIQENGRSKIIISSKGGSTIGVAPIFPWQKRASQNFSPDAIEASCLESIRNLNCDYLDVFQLHGISQSQITESLLNRLISMKKMGMYRYLGINTHTSSELQAITKHPDIFDMVLLDYNLVQLERKAIVSELAKCGIGVVAGTVLAQGHLISARIGSIATGSFFWYLARSRLKPTSRRLAEASKCMREVLSSITEMTPSQAAFSYILNDTNVSSCVFGTTNLDNCIEVLGASGKTLSVGSMEKISAAFKSMGYTIST